ncbi:hypothetical protein Tco_0418927 [Tanacetum coccineum]
MKRSAASKRGGGRCIDPDIFSFWWTNKMDMHDLVIVGFRKSGERRGERDTYHDRRKRCVLHWPKWAGVTVAAVWCKPGINVTQMSNAWPNSRDLHGDHSIDIMSTGTNIGEQHSSFSGIQNVPVQQISTQCKEPKTQIQNLHLMLKSRL